jgi:hypothetical protein
MQDFLSDLPYVDYVPVGVGALLLLFGRHLYWLALGGLGFWLGLTIADQNLALSANVELVVALGVGAVCAILTVVAMKVAVMIGGVLVGAVAAYHLALPWAADLDTQIWWLTLLGAVVGGVFARGVLDWALIVTSSTIGALLVAGSFDLAPSYRTIAFLALAAVGVVVQARGRAKKGPKNE